MSINKLCKYQKRNQFFTLDLSQRQKIMFSMKLSCGDKYEKCYFFSQQCSQSFSWKDWKIFSLMNISQLLWKTHLIIPSIYELYIFVCILSTYHPEYVIKDMIKLKTQKNNFLQIYVCYLAPWSQILGQKNIGILALCKKIDVKFLPWAVTFVVSSLEHIRPRKKWSISQTFIFKRGDEAEYFIDYFSFYIQ